MHIIIPALLGSFLVILPVTLHNAIVGDDIVLISASGGINFYIGNNPRATGYFETPANMRPGTAELIEDAQKIASEKIGRELKLSESSRYWYAQAWAWIRQNPGEWAKLLFRKALLFWNKYEAPVNLNYYWFKQHSLILQYSLSFIFIAPFALVGFVLSFREFNRFFLPILMLLTYFLSLTLYFVLAHYRVAAVPFMILFAVYGIKYLFNLISKKRVLLFLNMVILILAAFMVCYQPAKEPSFSLVYYNLGMLAFEDGNYKRAAERFSQAVEQDENFYLARYYLGVSLLNNQQTEQARKQFERIVETIPNDIKAKMKLAEICYRAGEFNKCIDLYRQVIGIDPEYQLAYSNLGVVFNQLGKYQMTVQVLSRASYKFPTNTEILKRLGVAYMNMENYSEAVRVLEKALLVDKTLNDARFNLATAYFKMGASEKAIKMFDEILKEIPDNPKIYNNLGIAYRQSGDLYNAVFCFNKAVELDADYVDAYYNLAEAYTALDLRKKALEAYEKLTELVPQDGKPYYYMAVLYATATPVNLVLAEQYYINAVTRGYKGHPGFLIYLEQLKEGESEETGEPTFEIEYTP